MIHKVLSLLQPWASLVVMGAKAHETRSWNTDYRGTILIHASAGVTSAIRKMACEWPFCEVLPKGKRVKKVPGGFGVDLDYMEHLPLGAIIGSVTLVDTIRTNRLSLNGLMSGTKPDHLYNMTDQERAFGDYTEGPENKGRYAWLLKDPVIFEKPIPAKGNLGLWKWEGNIPHTPTTYDCPNCQGCGCPTCNGYGTLTY